MIVISELDFAPIAQKLRRVLPEAMRFLPEIVRDQARLMISSTGSVPGMVQVIPPAHEGVKGPTAGRHGMAKVGGDIRRVYLTPSAAYQDIEDHSGRAAANAFHAALKGRTVTVSGGRNRRVKGTPQEAERILRASGSRYRHADVAPFDGGAAHRSLRLKDGTIGKRVIPRLVVINSRELQAYIKQRQANVGMMAAAFNAAAAFVRASGMPEYVTRHKTRWSSYQVLMTRTEYWLLLSAKLPFGMEEIERRWWFVLGYRLKAMDSAGFMTRIRKVFLEPASLAAAA